MPADDDSIAATRLSGSGSLSPRDARSPGCNAASRVNTLPRELREASAPEAPGESRPLFRQRSFHPEGHPLPPPVHVTYKRCDVFFHRRFASSHSFATVVF
jgi:hypothetical protein